MKAKQISHLRLKTARQWHAKGSATCPHTVLYVLEMVQMVEKSCSRMKENVRNLLESTFPTAFRAQGKRKELDFTKADIIKCNNNKV